MVVAISLASNRKRTLAFRPSSSSYISIRATSISTSAFIWSKLKLLAMDPQEFLRLPDRPLDVAPDELLQGLGGDVNASMKNAVFDILLTPVVFRILCRNVSDEAPFRANLLQLAS